MVVLCRPTGKDWFYLPGGHIEDGESSKTALGRELIEELGNQEFAIKDLIGVCENIFSLEEEVLQHEVNFVFEVNVLGNFLAQTTEKHIEFVKINKSEIESTNILPVAIKEGVITWSQNKKVFFIDYKSLILSIGLYLTMKD